MPVVGINERSSCVLEDGGRFYVGDDRQATIGNYFDNDQATFISLRKTEYHLT